jgi:limonene-1,2-epoxide hydrolase
MMSTGTRIVLEFIKAWNDNDIDRAHEFLAEKVFYHNIPMEPIICRDKARAFCDSFGLGVSMFADWRIVNIAEQGGYGSDRADRLPYPCRWKKNLRSSHGVVQDQRRPDHGMAGLLRSRHISTPAGGTRVDRCSPSVLK